MNALVEDKVKPFEKDCQTSAPHQTLFTPAHWVSLVPTMQTNKNVILTLNHRTGNRRLYESEVLIQYVLMWGVTN